MLILKENQFHPETGSLYIRFKDGELGFLRIIPQCEMEKIKRDGIITRDKRECEAILLSS